MDQTTYYLVAALGTTLAALMAAVNFGFTVRRNRKDAIREREVRAREVWAKYCELSFDHPRYSMAAVKKTDPEDYERYEWYVARMLFAAEEVLLLSTSDENWNGAIKEQISYHQKYLRENGRTYVDHYSPALQRLLRDEVPELEVKHA